MTKSRFLQPAFLILHKLMIVFCAYIQIYLVRYIFYQNLLTIYVNDKTDAENGDVEAIIRNRFA